MISRNVLARYHDIKVVVPHCGAYLPLAIPRMKSLTPVMQKNGMVGKMSYTPLFIDSNLSNYIKLRKPGKHVVEE